MFDRFIGNNHVKDLLRRMLVAKRIPGAFCFSGDEGLGKKQFALELAKALNCREPVNNESCDRCPACKRAIVFQVPDLEDKDLKKIVIFSNHPDIGMVWPIGRQLAVNQMRAIEREANFRPYEGRARVFIVNDAERLNDEASNALLKTLEEPAPTTRLILITTRPSALLPTIRSRCQIIRFAPIDAAEIEKFLVTTTSLAANDAKLVSQTCGGSLGRALSIDADGLRERRERMLGVIEAAGINKDRERLLRASEEINDPKRKDQFEPTLDMLESLVHDAWALSRGQAESRIVNSDLVTRLRKVGQEVTSRRAIGWMHRIADLRGQLNVNVNRKVAADSLFLSFVDD